MLFTGVVIFVCVQTYQELERVPGFMAWFYVLFLLFFILASLLPLSIGYLVLQPNIPESITILGKGLIHDTGRHRFQTRKTMGYENRAVAFNRARKRTSFSDQDCKSLDLTHIPVENRIFIEEGG